MSPMDIPANPVAMWVHLGINYISEHSEDKEEVIDLNRIAETLYPFLNDAGRAGLDAFFAEVSLRAEANRAVKKITQSLGGQL